MTWRCGHMAWNSRVKGRRRHCKHVRRTRRRQLWAPSPKAGDKDGLFLMTFEDNDSLVFSKTGILRFECLRASAESLLLSLGSSVQKDSIRINYRTSQHSSINWTEQREKSSNLVATGRTWHRFSWRVCKWIAEHWTDSLNLRARTGGELVLLSG